jgi:hypothetical protein
MPAGSVARTDASCASAPTTCGCAGDPAFAKTRRPDEVMTTPAYEPVKPLLTGAPARTTGLPARRPTASRTDPGSSDDASPRDVRV